MLPRLLPSMFCLSQRAACWLILLQERLLHRLAARGVNTFFPSSTFYIPLEELYLRADEIHGRKAGGGRRAWKRSAKRKNRGSWRRSSGIGRNNLSRRYKNPACKWKRVPLSPEARPKTGGQVRVWAGLSPRSRRHGFRKQIRHRKVSLRVVSIVRCASRCDLKKPCAVKRWFVLSSIVCPSRLNGFIEVVKGERGGDRKGPSAAPIVPVRTHASTQHQLPSSLHRFAVLSPEAPPRECRPPTLPPTSISTPRPPFSPLSSTPNTRTNAPYLARPRFPPDASGATSFEVLQLEGRKSVPLNSLYRSLLEKEYFHPVVRNVVAEMLTEDGMFLVRPSTHSKHLLTLSISNKGKIFNIVIRSRSDTKFALGTEKPGEIAFSSVDEMIKFHKREPIKVEDGSLVYLIRSPHKDKTCDCRR